MRKNVKLIVGILIGLLIGCSLVLATADVFSSNQVTFDNTNTAGLSDDVQTALEELYEMSLNAASSCPSGYRRYEMENNEFACYYKPIFADDAVLDNINSTYVNNETPGIDFSLTSNTQTNSVYTNGKGIYELASTKDDKYPIYYYRGAVNNNNLNYAGFCWKIVRTTSTGGIKLIYNGEPDGSGHCTCTTGTCSLLSSTRAFNSSYNDAKYVGYMYDTDIPSTIKGDGANAASGTIDYWYKTNILNKNDSYGNSWSTYLEDTVWCNDRSGSESAYGAYTRLYTDKAPSLDCPQTADRYTVNSDNGNGKLTYPVGLLTADELTYAGAVYGSGNINSSFYLYTNQNYWLLSPFFCGVGGACVARVHATGYLIGNRVNNPYGVRPSVSLKLGTNLSGEGTSSNPYTISLS